VCHALCQLLGKRTRPVDKLEVQAQPPSAAGRCYQPRPPARSFATKPAVKTTSRWQDSKRVCRSPTNSGHPIAAADALGSLHDAVLAAGERKFGEGALAADKQRHIQILEQAKDAAAAGSVALPVGLARYSDAAAADIPWPSDPAVWKQHRTMIWSGESALFFYSRSSDDAGSSMMQTVIAKRYHHGAGRAHERAVFGHLATAFSAQELRSYVRTRLPDHKRPPLEQVDQLQILYAARHFSERRSRYRFSCDPQSGPLLIRQGDHQVSQFMLRQESQPLSTNQRRGAIIRRLEWFLYYDFTLDQAVAPVRVPLEEDQTAPLSPSAATGNIADLRSGFFWRQTSEQRSSWEEMEQRSDRLALHLFRCLAAHHRASVLIGDLKPGNLFVNRSDLLPVFGDYGHATVFNKSGGRAVHSGRITPDLSARSRVLYRELSVANLSPPLALVVNELAPLSSTTKPSPRLVGTCSSIGTFAYRAMESLVPVTAGPTRDSVVTRGVYTQRSDLYSLAASLIEILVGYTCRTSSEQAEREAKSMRRLVRLRQQCDQLEEFSSRTKLDPCLKSKWLSQGAPACVSQPLIQLLRQLIEPPQLLHLQLPPRPQFSIPN